MIRKSDQYNKIKRGDNTNIAAAILLKFTHDEMFCYVCGDKMPSTYWRRINVKMNKHTISVTACNACGLAISRARRGM